jgi:DNA repair exonuclease SbcCD ATPase subunit
LDELNHQVLLKENELGISKLKELKSQLEQAQKQISQLHQKISEKDAIIAELKEKLKIKNFENLNLDKKVVDLEIVGILPCSNLDGDADIIEENKKLKGKIIKMKNAIIELSGKLEKELLLKEKKNLKINENNSKLFEDLQKKNKELIKMLKQENLQTMALRKEKYDLETICIKQENVINNLNNKLKSNSSKKKIRHYFFSRSNILPQNEGLPYISNNVDNSSHIQINSHNNSSFLPLVK